MLSSRAVALFERLRAGFWFVPSLMAATAVAASVLVVRLDLALADRVGREAADRDYGWLHATGPEGARAILSAISGSMVTVAGLTFSITMLTLQLASSQYGPRVLRSFMRDRRTQLVLGTFISTFAYCLLVLRAVRGVEGASFVPHLAVALGIGLALASLAVLIFFIHHVATAIRIETILAGLAREAREAIDRVYPAREATERRDADLAPPAPGRPSRPVTAHRAGYVQRVDGPALARLAAERDLVVRVEAVPGRFVARGEAVLAVVPAAGVTGGNEDALRAAFTVGPDRTPDQDPAFALRRIVEIAQRALSPGINDPTTALDCIDRLEEALAHLAAQREPEPWRRDEEGRARVLWRAPCFLDVAIPALAAVARYARDDADVTTRLSRALERLAGVRAPSEREALAALAADARAACRARCALGADRRALDGAAPA